MNKALIFFIVLSLGILGGCSGEDQGDTVVDEPPIDGGSGDDGSGGDGSGGDSSGGDGSGGDGGDQLPIVTEEKALFDDFESGWGNFLDGGEHSSLSTQKAYGGTTSVRIDGSYGAGSTLTLHNPFNLSAAQSVSVTFWLYSEDLSDGDALNLDFSDGTQWVNISHLVKGEDFGNGQFTQFSVSLLKEDHDFSLSSRFRFTALTLVNPIFIDDISIKAVVDVNAEPELPKADNSFTFSHETVFNGCSGCHNNIVAEGKNASHIETSNECQICHVANNPEGWLAFTYFTGSFDHTGVQNNCLSCHNGVLTQGKGPLHIDSSNQCETCHLPSRGNWNMGEGFLHPGIIDGCLGCHDGDTAEGKNETHIISSNDCQNCHTPNKDWTDVSVFDHQNIVDDCVSCHNGEISIGKKEFHIPSDDVCETCHSPVNGWWLSGQDNLNHDGFTAPCLTCHNGTITSGKTSDHIPTSDACEACHKPGGDWGDTELFSHDNITDTCVTCHNGVDRQGQGEFHIDSGDNCQICHVPNRGWLVELSGEFSHGNIVDGCVSCHDGSISTGKDDDHVPSGDRCETCHAAGLNWQVDVFAHADVTENCVSCHDGITSTGKPGDHIPSPETCETCHSPNNAWAVEVSANFSHNGLVSACVACHNGDVAQGKGVNHVPSDDTCESCHNPGGSWSDALFSHDGIVSGCINCHNGDRAIGKDDVVDHITSSNTCETCHQPENNWVLEVVDGFDHQEILSDCSVCHNGVTAEGKSANHIESSDTCETCHTPNGDWGDAEFDHDGIVENCQSCHDGVLAQGKNNNHLETVEADCSVCHTSTVTFNEAFYAHSATSDYPGDHNFGVSGLTCLGCHQQNNEVIDWPFEEYSPGCAGCHAGEFTSADHFGNSIEVFADSCEGCHVVSSFSF